MTQSGIKLFDFQGSPVILKWWFFILFAFLSPILVVIIFMSVLLHEMGHAYVANKLGYRVRGISIDVFFGAAEMDISQIHERDSIKITLGGPVINLILFLISSLIWIIIPIGSVKEILWSALSVNAILFISNMLPIFPTDGGRIFRDIMVIKNRQRAIEISAIVSLIFCILVAIFGAIFGHWMVVIFAIFFGYLAIKELKS